LKEEDSELRFVENNILTALIGQSTHQDLVKNPACGAFCSISLACGVFCLISLACGAFYFIKNLACGAFF